LLDAARIGLSGAGVRSLRFAGLQRSGHDAQEQCYEHLFDVFSQIRCHGEAPCKPQFAIIGVAGMICAFGFQKEIWSEKR